MKEDRILKSPKPAPQTCNFPGSCIVCKVKMKPEADWMLVERRQNPQKREAPSPSPEPETKCSRSRPKKNSRKPEITNHDKSAGGPAECSEETVVNDLAIEHTANHCSMHFASHGIDCKVETKLSTKTNCMSDKAQQTVSTSICSSIQTCR